MFILAMLLAAGDPPDYIGFSAKADRLAVMSNSVGSCGRFGYTVDQDGLLQLMQRTLAEAIYAGIDGGTAEAMIAGAVEREGQNMEYLAQQAGPSGSARARFMQYWRDRCAGLAQAADSGPYFRAN